MNSSHKTILNSINLSILTFVILFLNSCATASGPLFEQAEDPDADAAKIYIYRPDTAYLAGDFNTPDIIFDENNIGELAINGYVKLRTKPGKHNIIIRDTSIIAFFEEDLSSLNIDFKANNVYFLRFEASPSAVALLLGGGISSSELSFKAVTKEFALKELNGTHELK